MAISAVTIGVVLALATAASAHFFGGQKADNHIHSFCSTEENLEDRARMAPFVNRSMTHLDDVTVIVKNPVNCGDTSVEDVFWYVTPASSFPDPDTLAGTLCTVTLPNGRCGTFRIRFNKSKINRADQKVRHTACHEISHTLGSVDGHTASNGCFPQSSYSDGIYHTSHEKNHINNFYG